MPKKMILRIQSPEGTKRVEISPSESTCNLFEKAHDAFNFTSFAFTIYKNREKENEIISSRSKTLKSYSLNHGDMLYLVPLNGESLKHDLESERDRGGERGTDNMVEKSDKGEISQQVSEVKVTQDPVDIALKKTDGKIQRKRDDRLCRHGPNGCCLHCSPLEPYDEHYLREQNIKHMSFHSYLRKLTGGMDRGKFVALEDISCQIRAGCKDHPPWPLGICTKCQPNAITLNQQNYRHVDNVMFENPNLVERFLNYWRSTGHQRIGFLFGRYEVHNDVPLGIRATVAAIYEPPQESTRDSVKLLNDEKKELVKYIADQLGLQEVGWIFTDLVADDVVKGTVKHLRDINSYFLTAQECIMAGSLQNEHCNPCSLSPTGYFGSKFVTVCVTGDASNQVHMEGYQVSNQCMALVRDNCLIPTKDAAELGFVRESSEKQYVPDVYYKQKDAYGNEVTKLARPLPVEYLLIDVPVSTPMEPQHTFFTNGKIKGFPVENRLVDGHIQDFSALQSYMQQFTPEQFLKAASDFHFLIYIAGMDMLPMKEHMGSLLEAVRSKNVAMARDWSNAEHWATVEELFAASTSSGSQVVARLPNSESDTRVAGTSSSDSGLWTCPHCTYLNQAEFNNCEICNLPRVGRAAPAM